MGMERERGGGRERKSYMYHSHLIAVQTSISTYVRVLVKVVLVEEEEGCTAYQQPQTHHALHSQATHNGEIFMKHCTEF